MIRDIVFQGIGAPLRLHDADAVLPLLTYVASAWPYRSEPASQQAQPFFSIRSEPDAPLLLCQSHLEERPAQRWDPLNALCDAVSAMAGALAAEDDSVICLHAAGIEMAGRLVVFPNTRRAGKSTLSIALARSGHGLFGDDVLPVSISAEGKGLGHALGIAPRLRLPLPVGLDHEFRSWAIEAAGPRNQQYHYVGLDRQPVRGVTLPIGAFVILDRQDAPCRARLALVAPDVAMDALLHQNFTRDRHSVDVLRAMAAILADRPVYRLTYSGLADAVSCLEEAFDHWPGTEQPNTDSPPRRFRRMAQVGRAGRTLAPDARLAQCPGTEAVTIGDRLYLADRAGCAIHRMDSLAAAIWAFLEEPSTRPEIEAVLTDAFPATPRDQIAADLDSLLDDLGHAGVIEAQAAA